MIVAVDGRSLASGRGVGQYLGGMLAALAGAGVELRVVLPRGTPLARELAALPAITAVRHPAPSRLLHGSGALTGGRGSSASPARPTSSGCPHRRRSPSGAPRPSR